MTKVEIEAFFAVVNYGSISKAAEKQFISQSTLSGRIASLEQELGATLFSRGKGIKNTELTENGKEFLIVAEKWDRLWRESRELFLREQNRVLSIVAPSSINKYIFVDAAHTFFSDTREVRLRLYARNSDACNQLLENNACEAAFVAKPQFSRGISIIPLFQEKMLFVYNVAGFHQHDTIHPAILDPRKEVMIYWHRGHQQWHDYWFGATALPMVYTDDINILHEFLETEDCWAIVPASVAIALSTDVNVGMANLLDGPEDRTVYLLKQSARPNSVELDLLLNHLKMIVPDKGCTWLYEEGTSEKRSD